MTTESAAQSVTAPATLLAEVEWRLARYGFLIGGFVCLAASIIAAMVGFLNK
jgi:hypothetical protein